VLLALFHNPCGLMYKELSGLLLAFLIVELLAFLFQRGLDLTLTSLGFPIIECFPFLLKPLRSRSLAWELGSPQGSPGICLC
jgi:hypothetical protein